MSKRQDKIAMRAAERQDWLNGRRREAIEKKWEDIQVKAASAKSVLDFMVEQYNQHKSELPEDVITKTEEMIVLRQKEIEEMLMTGKDQYVREMKEYNDSI